MDQFSSCVNHMSYGLAWYQISPWPAEIFYGYTVNCKELNRLQKCNILSSKKRRQNNTFEVDSSPQNSQCAEISNTKTRWNNMQLQNFVFVYIFIFLRTTAYVNSCNEGKWNSLFPRLPRSELQLVIRIFNLIDTLVKFSKLSPTHVGSYCQRTSHTKLAAL